MTWYGSTPLRVFFRTSCRWQSRLERRLKQGERDVRPRCVVRARIRFFLTTGSSGNPDRDNGDSSRFAGGTKPRPKRADLCIASNRRNRGYVEHLPNLRTAAPRTSHATVFAAIAIDWCHANKRCDLSPVEVAPIQVDLVRASGQMSAQHPQRSEASHPFHARLHSI